MSQIEAAARQHLAFIRGQAIELERSEPGWNPMFYLTGSWVGDHELARRLRDRAETLELELASKVEGRPSEEAELQRPDAGVPAVWARWLKRAGDWVLNTFGREPFP